LRARRPAAHRRPRDPLSEARARTARRDQTGRLMKLTRRQVLAGAAAGVFGAGGIYELVDQLAGESPKRAAGNRLPEQHLLEGVRVVKSDGVEVLVPPLHHEILTANVAAGRGDLRDAQAALAQVLADLDRGYQPTPAGLGVTVAWGLPYF